MYIYIHEIPFQILFLSVFNIRVISLSITANKWYLLIYVDKKESGKTDTLKNIYSHALKA